VPRRGEEMVENYKIWKDQWFGWFNTNNNMYGVWVRIANGQKMYQFIMKGWENG